MQGILRVSNKNDGACFTFYLPAADPKEELL
jgi:signal transduction histidine kinase